MHSLGSPTSTQPQCLQRGQELESRRARFWQCSDDKSGTELVWFAELTVGEVAEHDGVGGVLHVLLLLGFEGAG
jgi:hypothetical protein